MPRIIFCLLIILALPTFAFAQESTGRLEGWVLDDQGDPLVGAEIKVVGPSILGQRSAVTGRDGYFQVAALPVGVCRVIIGSPGFHEFTLEDVAVTLGGTAGLGRIALTSEATVVETLVVTASPSIIDPVSTSVGGNLADGDLADLPLDRSYRDAPTLLPHIQNSFHGDGLNIAGGTGPGNKWYIDGVDVTDPMYGGDGMDLPYNFIREIRVRTGGYEAEFPGAQGGVVDVITYSGSNELRSELFGFYLNDQMVGEQKLAHGDPEEGGFTRWDVGGSLAGPLVRDRLWYYAAYNPAFDRQDIALPGLDAYETSNVTHRFAAKLDWLANDSNDFMLTVMGDPGKGDRAWLLPILETKSLANVDPALIDQSLGAVSLALKGRHYLGTGIYLQSGLSSVWNRSTWEPSTQRGSDEILFHDYETGVTSGGTMFADGANWVRGRDMVAGLDATVESGAHTLKFGAEYRINRVSYKDDTALLVRTDILGDWSYLERFLHTDGTVRNRIPAAFVQDTWRLGDRLRINVGLRWTGQYLEDSSGNTAVEITDQWQPRMGASLQLDDQGRVRIFGSAGRFYQDLSLAGPTNFLIEDSYTKFTFWDHDPRQDPAGAMEDIIVTETPIDSDVEGQYFDEVTLGYERELGDRNRLTVRGVHRSLGQALEDALSPELGGWVWGNPGSGDLASYPEASREYSAVEISLEGLRRERFNYLFSYVLSRTRGNTSGLFASDYRGGEINYGPQWDLPELMVNGHGLLPNDRPHVVKLAGSWRTKKGITLGTTLAWMSGTPLSEFGTSPASSDYKIFLEPRGTAGRTPSIWDLNLRVAYDLARHLDWMEHGRLICDLLHVGSPREATGLDQRRYWGVDEQGNQASPNDTYGDPVAYQPPFAVRIGLETMF